MLSRISQLRQTISDELEQASQTRPGTDPIAVIERNKELLNAETPNVEEIIMDIENSAEKVDNSTSETSNQSSTEEKSTSVKQTETVESDSKKEEPPVSQGVKSTITETKENSTANQPENSEPKLKLESNEDTNEKPKESTPDVQSQPGDPGLAAKLAKFARYEQKYPQLLKAYKTEKKKNELVKLYETVLAEHSPCTSISQPQELVDYLKSLSNKNDILQNELNSTKSELDSVKRNVDSFKRTSEQNASEIANLKQQITKNKSELAEKANELASIKKANLEAQANTKIDAEMRSKIESLESQLTAAEQTRNAAQKSQTTLKSQVEEINIRLSEVMSEADVIRDELVDSERLSRQRLNELNALKDSLRHRERDRRQSADNINDQITTLTAEKEQLEAEVEQLNKRIIRESEHQQTQIKSLRTQLKDSEEHEIELRKQLAQAHSRSETQLQDLHNKQALSITSNKAPESSDNDSFALKEAQSAAASASKANDLLKSVNSDNMLRIDKLQKAQRALISDLEQLRHENMVLKKRRSSITAPADGSPNKQKEAEKQQAYMKNIILGFAEHKDQRKTLLPVLATLFGFTESESDKFMKTL